ncbi:MAG: hypothetical protein COB67_00640 [SAR324 cluster bacterium]|uniref:Uncharacterized protein n=1 Tax=SAR324 cluster bacterium TaxID=2024889 RepID=A0A2A4TC98_9DELT|nr:MAG: hypothetical protein COB67_00640 [SAR324 cluster bacterium]
MKTVIVEGMITVSCQITLKVPEDATKEEILNKAQSCEENIEFSSSSPFVNNETFYIEKDGMPFDLTLEESVEQ